jgi:hypothetical protein
MPKHSHNSSVKTTISNWASLCLGCFIALLISACQADTAPSLSSPNPTVSKPFFKPTSRSEWRKLLAWDDDCEQSFTSTQAGDFSGIETLSIADDDELVLVMCAVGSYQPSFLLYRLKAQAPSALALETYTTADGETLSRTQEKELWGEPLFRADTKELIILNAARQTKDCGTWAKYSFTSDTVKLEELRAKLPCPSQIKESINVDPKNPLEGWRLINNR